MCTETKPKMINIGAFNVYNELLNQWGRWGAQNLMEQFTDTINEDFEQNKTPAQIARHIVKLFMAGR